MKFQLHPQSAAPAPAPAPVQVGDTPAPPPPSVRIERLEVEGCGAVSAAGLREGFCEAWQAGAHAAGSWPADAGERFRAPLALNVGADVSGRELGRRVAAAILARGSAGVSAGSVGSTAAALRSQERT